MPTSTAKYKEDSDKTLRKIKVRIKELEKIGDVSNVWGLSKKERADVITKSRLLLNDIARLNSKFINSNDIDNIYRDFYNRSAKQLRDMGFPVSRLTKKTPIEINEMKRQMINRMSDGFEVTDRLQLTRYEFIDEAIGSFNSGEVDAFRPRATLLDFQNSYQDKAGQKALMKDFRKVKRDILSLLDTSIRRGDSSTQVVKEMTKILSDKFPMGKISYPVRVHTKKGERISQRHVRIEDYAQTWYNDAATNAHTKGTLAVMKTSGADIVDVAGGITDNPICDPYVVGSPYSLTGKTPYPVLDKYPPYHPNCSKHIRVSKLNRKYAPKKK